MQYTQSFVRLYKSMKKPSVYTLSILVFLGILGLAIYYFNHSKSSTDLKTYTNSSYSLSFQYPKNYELNEAVSEGSTTITITEGGIRLPRDGEGPTSITVQMFSGTPQTQGKQSPAVAWIASSPFSNFNLSQMQNPGKTTIGGQEGYLYTWDGLYRGTTVVTEHKGNIISFTVTYDGETDLEKREAFTELIESVEFLHEEPVSTSTNSLPD
jgi:hypothetical protein